MRRQPTGSHVIMMLLKHLILLGPILAAATQSKPGCPEFCGDAIMPYPFGTRSGCYLDESFYINCYKNIFNDTTETMILRRTNIQVLNVSLDGELRVSATVASDCLNQSRPRNNGDNLGLGLARFPLSNTRNKFTAVGCATSAIVEGSLGQTYATGCISLCNRFESVKNGSCSGIGCCQTSIPEGVIDFKVTFQKLVNRSTVPNFSPCSYAFVVEEKMFNFSSSDLKDLRGKTTVPVVLDWAVGNETCEEAMKNQSSYACLALNSHCINSANGPGYRCNCSSGFTGNPYLPDGCEDIDECSEPIYPCDGDGICTNSNGSYSCSCPNGYEGDGKKDGKGCSKKEALGSTLLIIALGISISLLLLIVGTSWICWMLRKRKLIQLREKFFQQNGGFILKRQVSKHKEHDETTKIFTAEDLKKATNNYDEGRVIGQGGSGTVYKGILPDNKEVAIKKSKISDQSQIEQFINEVVILSKINHRNIVKLLGCCLETEVPLLVYEFITNGTLSDHLHDEARKSVLSWEMRLKIAAEAAGALAYLHSATSIPIIHRDIKSTNILLDDNYITKVSDFGASKLIPLNKSQLTTLVQGTFGYLDPEYFLSSQLTEKSDVYSFGVVLTELLTGEKAISFDRAEENRNLAMYFVSSMKEDRLLEVVDDRLVEEGKIEQVKEVAAMAKWCLRLKGEERPTMKEVAMELEGLRIVNKHPWVDIDLNTEESEHLLGVQSVTLNAHKSFVGSGSCSNSTEAPCDSMRDQIIMPLEVEFR